MTSRRHLVGTLAIGVALVIGLVAWLVTMASAPRYSPQDMGDLDTYCLVLLGAAAATGAVAGRRGAVVAAVLGLPGLALSPWTAPRGDNDGLWSLTVPILLGFVILLATVGAAAAWVRGHLSSAWSSEE